MLGSLNGIELVFMFDLKQKLLKTYKVFKLKHTL